MPNSGNITEMSKVVKDKTLRFLKQTSEFHILHKYFGTIATFANYFQELVSCSLLVINLFIHLVSHKTVLLCSKENDFIWIEIIRNIKIKGIIAQKNPFKNLNVSRKSVPFAKIMNLSVQTLKMSIYLVTQIILDW